MTWNKIEIKNDEGQTVDAQAPVIVSASRATDIPTFYPDWFVSRWDKGHIKWTNPFNGVPLYISFEKIRAVVFWTKNPRPMFKYLDYLDDNIPNYYFQFTLNDYDNEGFEGNVPKLDTRIKSFIELSNRLGKKRVVWRFDPLILTKDIDVKELLKRIENIGNQLKDYTEKLVFSFADISSYRKVKNNLEKEHVDYIEFTKETMVEVAQALQTLNEKWGFQMGTCTEKIDLDKYGIVHNKCIDDDLMIDLFHEDEELMDFLGVEYEAPSLFDAAEIKRKPKKLKDKGQREDCGCIMSKDIGQYNTCPHECNYCYANTSKEIAKKNYKQHLQNPDAETIIGK